MLAAAVAIAAGSAQAEARMTVVYDLPTSLLQLVSTQSDGSPGLSAADGLFQQVAGALPVDRQLGGLTGGVGTASTPTIRDLPPGEIVGLMTNEIDTAEAHMVFIDLGPDYDTAGPDAANLEAAMLTMAATPHALGGTYADRVHLYLSRAGDIADPGSRPQFWHAMALTGGVWLEAYLGREPWPAEYWRAWPRALRDGLVARGMDPARLHIIVRGANQAGQWANFRVGVACELLANGPGAYRIEDHLGYVTQFRDTFGVAPAPAGPSVIACQPEPVLDAGRAATLATVLARDGRTTRLPRTAVSASRVTPRTTKVVTIRLGADPLGIAGQLGTDPVAFWSAAAAHVTASGGGADASAPVTGGVARLVLSPASSGPIALRLTIDGRAFRDWIGAPVDPVLSLAAHRPAVDGVLHRMIGQPTGWMFTVPLAAPLRSAPPPPRITVRVLLRSRPPARSRVELRLSRPATRLLVQIGVRRGGGFVSLRRLRITGRRVVVAVRLPAGAPVIARVVPV